MNWLKPPAILLAFALGATISAAAHDDHHDAHKAAVRREHREAVRNRERLAREHREHRQADLARDRRHREAMHKWDRDHHRGPVAAKHHESRPNGWDHGKKAGWHGKPVPPKHQAHMNRPNPPRPVPASQRNVVRPLPDNHIAQARR